MNEKKGKVFDEKGRLFGKVNIIDLIVLVLIVAVAVVLVLKLTNRSGSGLPGNAATSQIEYTVKVPQVQESVYAAVKAEIEAGGQGAQLMANGEMLDAYILEVSSEPYVIPVEKEDGTVVMVMCEDQDTVFDSIIDSLQAG